MIVLLISIVWLAALALILAACRMAASGDREQARRERLSIAPQAERTPCLLDTPTTPALTLTRNERRRPSPSHPTIRARRSIRHARRLAERSDAAR
jgi:hypothetical protein